MSKQSPVCFWCNRPKNEVKIFVAAKEEGPHACNRCIVDLYSALESGQERLKSTSSKEERLRTPQEIKRYLDEHVIAQDRAKTDVAVAVYNHYKRRESKKRLSSLDLETYGQIEIQKSNILLIGPSGVGKTEVARSIARMLKVPFYIGDATKLTQAGYVGDDVESLLQGLLEAADNDVEKAEWGIIFIDEIDKIARKNGRGMAGYRDVSGEGVQQALLKLLEGSKVSVSRGGGAKIASMQMSDVVDTTNILFICAGSFAGIEEIVTERAQKGGKRVGFGSDNTSSHKKLTKSEVYSQVIEEDILDFGVIPEMMGRLPILTTTIELTESEMVRVLTEPKNAIVKQFKALFAMDGVALTFTDEGLRAIGAEAKKRPTGARALRSIVERVLSGMMFEAPGSDIESLVVTDKSVAGEGLIVGRRVSAEKA